MGAMQGQNLEQIYNRIADVLWETQVLYGYLAVVVACVRTALLTIILCSRSFSRLLNGNFGSPFNFLTFVLFQYDTS